jgi:hypothetical protein
MEEKEEQEQPIIDLIVHPCSMYKYIETGNYKLINHLPEFKKIGKGPFTRSSYITNEFKKTSIEPIGGIKRY